MPWYRLSSNERQTMLEVIDQYQEAEEDARRATVDDPLFDTTESLVDILDDYNTRKRTLDKIKRKLRRR